MDFLDFFSGSIDHAVAAMLDASDNIPSATELKNCGKIVENR
jgi:hypothetical protein